MIIPTNINNAPLQTIIATMCLTERSTFMPLLRQTEPEAQEIAIAIELFTSDSLNIFAKPTNVDVNNRLICYDVLDLGKQLLPVGMLAVLDSILNCKVYKGFADEKWEEVGNVKKKKSSCKKKSECYIRYEHSLWNRLYCEGTFRPKNLHYLRNFYLNLVGISRFIWAHLFYEGQAYLAK
jgi:hypothetical protein